MIESIICHRGRIAHIQPRNAPWLTALTLSTNEARASNTRGIPPSPFHETFPVIPYRLPLQYVSQSS
jgi:hypothetical protein